MTITVINEWEINDLKKGFTLTVDKTDGFRFLKMIDSIEMRKVNYIADDK